MAKNRKPQQQQADNDPSQMIIGGVIGAVIGAVVTGGIFLVAGSSGGGSASETVSLNAQPAQAENAATEAAVPIPGGGAVNAEPSSQPAGETTQDPLAASPGMEMQLTAGEGKEGADAAAAGGIGMPEQEMAMQMEMAANAKQGAGDPAVPGAGPEMSAEMAMSEEMAAQMAANNAAAGPAMNGTNVAATSISPEMKGFSLGGAGEPGEAGGPGSGLSSGTAGKSITGKPDPAFEAELAEMKVPDQNLNLQELTRFVQPSVVQIKTEGSNGAGVGTGFIVSKTGLVITSYRVMEGAERATVQFSDGTKGNVAGYRLFDPFHEIAIIQIEVPGKKLKPIPVGDILSSKGEQIVSFSASRASKFSSTSGTVSEVFDQKQMQVESGVGMKGTWLQTSVPITPEASGAPLVNMRGQVVAMNAMQASIGKNLNYAVSSLDLLTFAKVGSGKEVAKLDPEKLSPSDDRLKRLAASDIQGSEKASQLLTKIEKMNIQLVYDQARLDPNSLLKNGIFAYAKRNIEKMDIPVSVEEPQGDDPVMIVTIRTKATRKTDLDRQTVLANAFLITKDSTGQSGTDFVKIWSVNDYELGTVSIRALSQGFIPKTFAPKVSSFFNKFKSAHSKANRNAKAKKS